jgi:hypothetical protein
MDASRYFADQLRDRRMLEAHGFDAWPDADELTRYACGLEDALRAIAGHLGCDLVCDERDDWGLVRRSGREVA